VCTLDAMTRPTRLLLLGVAACAVLFGLLLVAAYAWPHARWVDASALQGFVGLQRPTVNRLAVRIGDLGNAREVTAITLGLIALALARSRPRVALAVVVLVGLTSVSSQLLKALLAYPRYDLEGTGVGPSAFPSGHSTAAMTLAIAGVLVAPRKLRPLAAFVGVGFALAVGFSVIALGWHFPSDVAGGFLLATGWGLVIASALRAAAARWPEGTGRSRGAVMLREGVDRVAAVGLFAAAIVGLGLAALVTATLLLTRLSDLVDYADRHTAFVVVAAALGASAVGLLGVVTLALRRR
jgi:membrane-associated phospholipid phosphatase